MAWTAPRTWVTGEQVTAAIMNTHVRDNFLITAPAKATAIGDIFFANAVNSIGSGLAAGTTANFLRGGTANPTWNDTLLGDLTLGATGTNASLAVFRSIGHIAMHQRGGTDVADQWIVEHVADEFKIRFFDDSLATSTDSLAIAEGDFILHTGLNNTGEGAVVIANDIDTGTLAVVTTGTAHLTTGALATGGPAYVEGFYNLSLKRVAAGAATDSVNILPRDDGANVSTRFRIDADEDMIPNAIPNNGDTMTIFGNFWVRFTSSNSSTWTLFLSADTNGVFEVTDASLLVRSTQYPT